MARETKCCAYKDSNLIAAEVAIVLSIGRGLSIDWISVHSPHYRGHFLDCRKRSKGSQVGFPRGSRLVCLGSRCLDLQLDLCE